MVLGYESLSAPTFGPVSPHAPGLIAPRGGATGSLEVGDWGSSYKAYYVKSTVSTFNLFMVGSWVGLAWRSIAGTCQSHRYSLACPSARVAGYFAFRAWLGPIELTH